MAETKQMSLRISTETMDKLKYIAWFDRESFTDLIIAMSEEKIKKFEKANGAITDELLEKAKIK